MSWGVGQGSDKRALTNDKANDMLSPKQPTGPYLALILLSGRGSFPVRLRVPNPTDVGGPTSIKSAYGTEAGQTGGFWN